MPKEQNLKIGDHLFFLLGDLIYCWEQKGIGYLTKGEKNPQKI